MICVAGELVPCPPSSPRKGAPGPGGISCKGYAMNRMCMGPDPGICFFFFLFFFFFFLPSGEPVRPRQERPLRRGPGHFCRGANIPLCSFSWKKLAFSSYQPVRYLLIESPSRMCSCEKSTATLPHAFFPHP
ncbi:hypothetical protein BDW75DRAFT_63538 [Aspergillus navahoensis]